ncbi:MAG: TetR/AcrR family transcriptional regulator [Dehalococcoidia bacterium]|nr:TetR/AcrR family transcriptional regulator [Dehalococcoidia bacterium]
MPKSLDRKKEILAAARHILSTEGADALTMRDLARAVGLTQSSLYRHFKNKIDILQAVFQEGCGRFQHVIDTPRVTGLPLMGCFTYFMTDWPTQTFQRATFILQSSRPPRQAIFPPLRQPPGSQLTAISREFKGLLKKAFEKELLGQIWI